MNMNMNMKRTCARKLIFWTILCQLSPDMDGIWSSIASISPSCSSSAIWDFAQTPYWDRRIWPWIWTYKSREKPMKTIRDTRVRTSSWLLASFTDILSLPTEGLEHRHSSVMVCTKKIVSHHAFHRKPSHFDDFRARIRATECSWSPHVYSREPWREGGRGIAYRW